MVNQKLNGRRNRIRQTDEIYFAILLPNVISNSYEWKIRSILLTCCLITLHGLEYFKQDCQQEYIACQWSTCSLAIKLIHVYHWQPQTPNFYLKYHIAGHFSYINFDLTLPFCVPTTLSLSLLQSLRNAQSTCQTSESVNWIPCLTALYFGAIIQRANAEYGLCWQ